MAERPELVVFDLTGTTVRDDGAILASFRAAMEQHGIPFTEEEIAALRGSSKLAVFQTMAEKGLAATRRPEEIRRVAEQAYASFEGMLRESYTRGPMEEIPGAEAAIRQLKVRGMKVAATTGLERHLRDRVLERLGWREGLFDAMVSPDEVSQGRPAPYMIFEAMMRTRVTDVRRVAVVGDTPLDMLAGSNAGAAWVVAVLSGAHGLGTLGVAPHTHILDSVTGLPELFG